MNIVSLPFQTSWQVLLSFCASTSGTAALYPSTKSQCTEQRIHEAFTNAWRSTTVLWLGTLAFYFHTHSTIYTDHEQHACGCLAVPPANNENNPH